MAPTTRFTLAPIAERDGERWSALLSDGRPTGTELPGAVLEAAYECATGVLLFSTQDSPFEEQLDILLLGPDLRVEDRATLGAAYSTGTFRDPVADGGDAVTFSFFAGDRWRAACLPKPAWRWPWAPGSGVSRPFSLSSRLTVERLRAEP